MGKRKKQEIHMIDMSGRFQVKIVNADKDEIDQNNKFFDELNENIRIKTQKNNDRINAYIKELLIQTPEATNIEISYFEKYYNNMNIEDIHEFYKSYISDLKRNIEKAKEQED